MVARRRPWSVGVKPFVSEVSVVATSLSDMCNNRGAVYEPPRVDFFSGHGLVACVCFTSRSMTVRRFPSRAGEHVFVLRCETQHRLGRGKHRLRRQAHVAAFRWSPRAWTISLWRPASPGSATTSVECGCGAICVRGQRCRHQTGRHTQQPRRHLHFAAS